MTSYYHYTSAEGLKGIICSQKLRATDIRFLNDYREFNEGLTHALTRLNELSINAEGDSPEEADSLRHFYSRLATLVELEGLRTHSFVTSFTDKKDNLRQWMSYGKMNASYCIGFKSDFFDALKGKLSTTPTSGLSYAFEKVSYEGHQHVNSIIAIENIILRIDAAISGNDVDNDELMDDFASKLVDEMIEKIMFAACAIKPKEFTDESESRLIFLTNEAKIAPQNIQICERSGILIPFIDFEFDYEWIEEIIIGPNIQTDLAQKGLESLLKSKGINCKVTPTTCTLRQF